MTDETVGHIHADADLLLAMAIRTAATLRLADLIEEGGSGLGELAQRARADPGGLGRLLRYLASRGYFEQPSPDVFGLNGRSRVLLDDHPSGSRRWLDLEHGMGSRISMTYVDMLDAVRLGRPVYETRYGLPFWEDVGADSSRNAAMSSVMARDGADQKRRLDSFIGSYDWNGAEHVIDVGGGDGGVLLEVLRALPGVRGTLLELADRLEGLVKRPADSALWDRCSLLPGSFFDPLPAGADVYLLTNVLGDWDDDAATLILRRCAEAAGDSGRVVVPGDVPESRSEPGMATNDLMLLTALGGYLRVRSDMTALATAAGLRVSRFEAAYTELVVDAGEPSA